MRFQRTLSVNITDISSISAMYGVFSIKRKVIMNRIFSTAIYAYAVIPISGCTSPRQWRRDSCLRKRYYGCFAGDHQFADQQVRTVNVGGV